MKYFLIVPLLFLVFTGCERKVVREGCDSNSDCVAGRQCVRNVCRSARDANLMDETPKAVEGENGVQPKVGDK